jgi:predicted XRE-type DNA-binding protein
MSNNDTPAYGTPSKTPGRSRELKLRSTLMTALKTILSVRNGEAAKLFGVTQPRLRSDTRQDQSVGLTHWSTAAAAGLQIELRMLEPA